MRNISLTLILVGVFVLGGCTNREDHAAAPAGAHDAAPPSNRIAIPVAVRHNLGITFATVERRAVRQTLRIPGEFELQPEARREIRAMAPGRVDLHVRQFQHVEPGTLLLTLDSPHWREVQHETVEAEGSIKVTQASMDVAVAQKTENEQAAKFLRQRIDALNELELRNVELESQLKQLENTIPRLEAQIQARRVELQEAIEHFRSRLNTLASLTGFSIESLEAPVSDTGQDQPLPRWRILSQLELRSDIGGVVDSLNVTDGTWMETGGLAMTIVDPKAIRFRANALQSDLGLIAAEQSARIVPPQGGSVDLQDDIEANLSIGFQGSPSDRTIPIFAVPQELSSWARPGVAAFLEVVIGGTATPELAIPASAVVRDGITPVVFRRDPANPDAVIRLEADLGPGDGRWIVINSGVKQGDEVVLDGAYQLMLASSGTIAKGGHFHADGTFHAGDDQ